LSELVVTDLAVYPVKSLRGISLPIMHFDVRGPLMDRRFIVTDAAGHFLTQRRYPKMCLVQVEVRGEVYALTAPEMPTLVIDPARDPCVQRHSVVVWQDRVDACDVGAEAADWFSAYLHRPCRLYFMPDDSVRAVDPDYGRSGDRISFADGFPVLLITEASLDVINRALPEPIAAERFRPNIVISGCEPFAEDRWRRVRIGGLEFDVVKPCSRCAIPSIDPLTGNRQRAVAQTLTRLRRRGDGVYFGQNLIHRGSGSIGVGATAVVLESGESSV
jgi:uncharacterized protein YcbX